MLKVMDVVGKIWDLEGFAVRITDRDGRNVIGVRKRFQFPRYDYKRAAANNWTVEDWKATRFKEYYPEFDVKVLDADGIDVRGNTRLGTVRKSYS